MAKMFDKLQLPATQESIKVNSIITVIEPTITPLKKYLSAKGYNNSFIKIVLIPPNSKGLGYP